MITVALHDVKIKKSNLALQCAIKHIPLFILGTSHIDELGYLFKSILTPNYINPCSPEAVVLWKMVRMWTSFARTGNPNPVREGSEVTWEPIDKGKINFLDIGSNLTVGVNPESERVAFWAGLPAAVTAKDK